MAGFEQRLAARIEGALQVNDEFNRLGRQNLGVAFSDGSEELHIGNLDGTGHSQKLRGRMVLPFENNWSQFDELHKMNLVFKQSGGQHCLRSRTAH